MLRFILLMVFVLALLVLFAYMLATLLIEPEYPAVAPAIKYVPLHGPGRP